MIRLAAAGRQVLNTRDRIEAPTVVEVGSLSPSRFETVLPAREFDDVCIRLQRPRDDAQAGRRTDHEPF